MQKAWLCLVMLLGIIILLAPVSGADGVGLVKAGSNAVSAPGYIVQAPHTTYGSSSDSIVYVPSSGGSGSPAIQTASGSSNTGKLKISHGLMHFTAEEMQERHAAMALLPKVDAYQGPALPKAKKTLLSYIPYVGEDRDQGDCGNCWIWAGTGALEVEHQIDTGIRKRLSVQYFNSNYYGGKADDNNACNGGDQQEMASYYNKKLKKVIPWSNRNAGYADYEWAEGEASGISASSISTSPNYPIKSISCSLLNTYSTQAQAINSIKAQINAKKPVMWGYFLSESGWNAFDKYWDSKTESSVWNPDLYNGKDNAGGHEVLIVGYDDTVSTPYWLVLNSWGTTSGRPKGLMRLKMYINYRGKIAEGEDVMSPYPAASQMYTHDFTIFNTNFKK